jgi:hypothetical protein
MRPSASLPRAGKSPLVNEAPSGSSASTDPQPAPPDAPPPGKAVAPRGLSSQRPTRFLQLLQKFSGDTDQSQGLYGGRLESTGAKSTSRTKVNGFLDQVAWSLPEEVRNATMKELKLVVQGSAEATEGLARFCNREVDCLPAQVHALLDDAFSHISADFQSEVLHILSDGCMEKPAAAAGASPEEAAAVAPHLNVGKFLLAAVQCHSIKECCTATDACVRAMRNRAPHKPPPRQTPQEAARRILDGLQLALALVDGAPAHPSATTVGYANKLFKAMPKTQRDTLFQALWAHLGDVGNMENFACLANGSNAALDRSFANGLLNKVPLVKQAVLEILPSLPAAPLLLTRSFIMRAQGRLDERMEQHRDIKVGTAAAEAARLALAPLELEKFLRSQCRGREPIIFGEEEYASACWELAEMYRQLNPSDPNPHQRETRLGDGHRVVKFLLDLRSENPGILLAIALGQEITNDPANDLVDMLIFQARMKIAKPAKAGKND